MPIQVNPANASTIDRALQYYGQVETDLANRQERERAKADQRRQNRYSTIGAIGGAIIGGVAAGTATGGMGAVQGASVGATIGGGVGRTVAGGRPNVGQAAGMALNAAAMGDAADQAAADQAATQQAADALSQSETITRNIENAPSPGVRSDISEPGETIPPPVSQPTLRTDTIPTPDRVKAASALISRKSTLGAGVSLLGQIAADRRTAATLAAKPGTKPQIFGSLEEGRSAIISDGKGGYVQTRLTAPGEKIGAGKSVTTAGGVYWVRDNPKDPKNPIMTRIGDAKPPAGKTGFTRALQGGASEDLPGPIYNSEKVYDVYFNQDGSFNRVLGVNAKGTKLLNKPSGKVTWKAMSEAQKEQYGINPKTAAQISSTGDVKVLESKTGKGSVTWKQLSEKATEKAGYRDGTIVMENSKGDRKVVQTPLTPSQLGVGGQKPDNYRDDEGNLYKSVNGITDIYGVALPKDAAKISLNDAGGTQERNKSVERFKGLKAVKENPQSEVAQNNPDFQKDLAISNEPAMNDEEAVKTLTGPNKITSIPEAIQAGAVGSISRLGRWATDKLGAILNIPELQSKADILKAEAGAAYIRLANNTIRSTFNLNSRYPVWEQQILNESLVDPNAWFASPDIALAKTNQLKVNVRQLMDFAETDLASGKLDNANQIKVERYWTNLKNIYAMLGGDKIFKAPPSPRLRLPGQQPPGDIPKGNPKNFINIDALPVPTTNEEAEKQNKIFRRLLLEET